MLEGNVGVLFLLSLLLWGVVRAWYFGFALSVASPAFPLSTDKKPHALSIHPD
jgi:hypothetical protein